MLVFLLAAFVLAVVGWTCFQRAKPTRVTTDGETPTTSREASRGRASARERSSAEDATAALFGVVSAQDGGPIDGAVVCALPVVRGGPRDPLPTCVRTSEGGAYEITGSIGVSVRLHASASGYRPGRYVDPTSGESTVSFSAEGSKARDLVLVRGGVPMRGIVRDAAGGEIQGALVIVGRARPWESLEADGGVGGFSDGDGAFEVWSEPGDVVVHATAECYAPAGVRGVAPGFVEITLTPESVIAGRVVRAGTDEGVADALVEVGAIGMELSNVPTRVPTDAEGRFRFAQLSPSRYKPRAEADHLRGEARESVLLGVGETSDDVVIELHTASLVEGRVLFADSERPCGSGSVTLGDQRDSALSEEIEHRGACASVPSHPVTTLFRCIAPMASRACPIPLFP